MSMFKSFKIKKKTTLIEALLTVIAIIWIILILVDLMSSTIYKRNEIWYNLKRININTTFNSNFWTMVCYYNNNEQMWVQSDWTVKYWKFHVRNWTNTDAENTLCASIRNHWEMEWNTFLWWWEPVSFDWFILTRSNFKNIATYKIMYILKVEDENDSNKAQSYIVRFWAVSIEWFLTTARANTLYDDLVVKSPQWTLWWKQINAEQYWYKYRRVRINLIDDTEVDLNPSSAWWWWTSVDDYTFNYNYFLFQLQFSDWQFSNFDYFLFKNW